MAQWGSTDQSNNSPYWVAAIIKQDANSANRDAMFDNNTPSVRFKQTIGVFGADAVEVHTSNGVLLTATVTYAGSGYAAAPTITLSGTGTANTTANTTGKVSAIGITAIGSGYLVSPTVTIAAPAPVTFAANTTGTTSNNFINITANILQNGDKVTYSVATGNTALTNLVSGTKYAVVGANTTGVQLSTNGTTAITFAIVVANEAGHSLTGDAATGVISVTGGDNKGIAHQGWVLRREGTGGRAGRVHYETLVALNLKGDSGSDDPILKNS